MSNKIFISGKNANSTAGAKNIKDLLKVIPKKPGVYIFKDSGGNIIYIGKAKNLLLRLRSYFRSKNKSTLYAKPADFIKKIKSIDYVVTDNETEALILESSLIKKNRPKYNLDLKDDKSYPFIAVTIEDRFPRVFLTRDRNIAGAKYFGPYTDARAVRKTIECLRKMFRVRDCRKVRPGKGTGIPCLNFYINMCSAPCSGNISPEEYRRNIDLIILFLKGKNKAIIGKLNSEMEAYSAGEEFEKAAEIKDIIESLNKLHDTQKVFFTGGDRWDFISTAGDVNKAAVSLFNYRSGKLVLVNNFTVDNTGHMSESEILSAFIRDYYANIDDMPAIIFCQVEIENAQLISEWLSKKTGRKVEILVPRIGEKKKIMKMAVRNSILYLEKKKFEKDTGQGKIYRDFIKLKKLLGLINIPRKIECYDISNIKDSFPVGSMAVAIDGKMKNSRYRHFKIKTVTGQDDCRMIGEVITRRLRYLQEDDKNKAEEKLKKNDVFNVKPDLMVIDGGKAQYNTAGSILDKNNITDVDLISIAKKEEVIFCRKYPDGLKLNLNDSSVRILIRVRDEAHRFAVNYHRKLRSKNMFNSLLDGIKGIGEKKKKIVIENTGSIDKLRTMTEKELMNIKGLSVKDAKNIYRNIHR